MEERRRRVYMASMLLGISFFIGTAGSSVMAMGGPDEIQRFRDLAR